MPRTFLRSAIAPVPFEHAHVLSEEVLCPGSSDDEDSNVQREKKRRRTGLGEQYLEGQALTILTASLRGPFDNPWINPWRRNHIVKEEAKEETQIREIAVQTGDAEPSLSRRPQPLQVPESTNAKAQIEGARDHSPLNKSHGLPIEQGVPPLHGFITEDSLTFLAGQGRDQATRTPPAKRTVHEWLRKNDTDIPSHSPINPTSPTPPSVRRGGLSDETRAPHLASPPAEIRNFARTLLVEGNCMTSRHPSTGTSKPLEHSTNAALNKVLYPQTKPANSVAQADSHHTTKNVDVHTKLAVPGLSHIIPKVSVAAAAVNSVSSRPLVTSPSHRGEGDLHQASIDGEHQRNLNHHGPAPAFEGRVEEFGENRKGPNEGVQTPSNYVDIGLFRSKDTDSQEPPLVNADREPWLERSRPPKRKLSFTGSGNVKTSKRQVLLRHPPPPNIALIPRTKKKGIQSAPAYAHQAAPIQDLRTSQVSSREVPAANGFVVSGAEEWRNNEEYLYAKGAATSTTSYVPIEARNQSSSLEAANRRDFYEGTRATSDLPSSRPRTAMKKVSLSDYTKRKKDKANLDDQTLTADPMPSIVPFVKPLNGPPDASGSSSISDSMRLNAMPAAAPPASLSELPEAQVVPPPLLHSNQSLSSVGANVQTSNNLASSNNPHIEKPSMDLPGPIAQTADSVEANVEGDSYADLSTPAAMSKAQRAFESSHNSLRLSVPAATTKGGSSHSLQVLDPKTPEAQSLSTQAVLEGLQASPLTALAPCYIRPKDGEGLNTLMQKEREAKVTEIESLQSFSKPLKALYHEKHPPNAERLLQIDRTTTNELTTATPKALDYPFPPAVSNASRTYAPFNADSHSIRTSVPHSSETRPIGLHKPSVPTALSQEDFTHDHFAKSPAAKPVGKRKKAAPPVNNAWTLLDPSLPQALKLFLDLFCMPDTLRSRDLFVHFQTLESRKGGVRAAMAAVVNALPVTNGASLPHDSRSHAGSMSSTPPTTTRVFSGPDLPFTKPKQLLRDPSFDPLVRAGQTSSWSCFDIVSQPARRPLDRPGFSSLLGPSGISLINEVNWIAVNAYPRDQRVLCTMSLYLGLCDILDGIPKEGDPENRDTIRDKVMGVRETHFNNLQRILVSPMGTPPGIDEVDEQCQRRKVDMKLRLIRHRIFAPNEPVLKGSPLRSGQDARSKPKWTPVTDIQPLSSPHSQILQGSPPGQTYQDRNFGMETSSSERLDSPVTKERKHKAPKPSNGCPPSEVFEDLAQKTNNTLLTGPQISDQTRPGSHPKVTDNPAEMTVPRSSHWVSNGESSAMAASHPMSTHTAKRLSHSRHSINEGLQSLPNRAHRAHKQQESQQPQRVPYTNGTGSLGALKGLQRDFAQSQLKEQARPFTNGPGFLTVPQGLQTSTIDDKLRYQTRPPTNGARSSNAIKKLQDNQRQLAKVFPKQGHVSGTSSSGSWHPMQGSSWYMWKPNSQRKFPATKQSNNNSHPSANFEPPLLLEPPTNRATDVPHGSSSMAPSFLEPPTNRDTSPPKGSSWHITVDPHGAEGPSASDPPIADLGSYPAYPNDPSAEGILSGEREKVKVLPKLQSLQPPTLQDGQAQSHPPLPSSPFQSPPNSTLQEMPRNSALSASATTDPTIPPDSTCSQQANIDGVINGLPNDINENTTIDKRQTTSPPLIAGTDVNRPTQNGIPNGTGDEDDAAASRTPPSPSIGVDTTSVNDSSSVPIVNRENPLDNINSDNVNVSPVIFKSLSNHWDLPEATEAQDEETRDALDSAGEFLSTWDPEASLLLSQQSSPVKVK